MLSSVIDNNSDTIIIFTVDQLSTFIVIMLGDRKIWTHMLYQFSISFQNRSVSESEDQCVMTCVHNIILILLRKHWDFCNNTVMLYYVQTYCLKTELYLVVASNLYARVNPQHRNISELIHVSSITTCLFHHILLL